MSPIRELAWRDGAVVGERRARGRAARGAERVRRGGVRARRRSRNASSAASCRRAAPCTTPSGWASGALCFDLDLAPGADREIWLAVAARASEPPRTCPRCARASARATLAQSRERWQRDLGAAAAPRSRRRAQPMRRRAAHAPPRTSCRARRRRAPARAAALHALVDPRRRDDERRRCCGSGARARCADFLRWYAPYQAADGNVPCCVDRNGPDWLAEHDSHGQLDLHGGRALPLHGRPRARRGAVADACARAARLPRAACARSGSGAEFEAPERRACRGILPESVSHEGYLAHPVHAYWDDFWALRGLGDAARLARALGDDARRRAAARRARRAARVPVRLDRGDDRRPRARHAAGLGRVGRLRSVRDRERARDQRRDRASARRICSRAPTTSTSRASASGGSGELDWNNYTPYEIRIIGALVRLGRRAEAHELLDGVPRRSPPARVEPVARDRVARPAQPRPPRRSAAHLDRRGVRARGALAVRLRAPGRRRARARRGRARGAGSRTASRSRVEELATAYGTLGVSDLRAPGDGRVDLALASALAPPGGIVLRPPLPGPLRGVEIDGRPTSDFDRGRRRARARPGRGDEFAADPLRFARDADILRRSAPFAVVALVLGVWWLTAASSPIFPTPPEVMRGHRRARAGGHAHAPRARVALARGGGLRPRARARDPARQLDGLVRRRVPGVQPDDPAAAPDLADRVDPARDPLVRRRRRVADVPDLPLVVLPDRRGHHDGRAPGGAALSCRPRRTSA